MTGRNVNAPVIVCKGDDHDRPDFDLSVDHYRLFFDGVHAQYRRLRQVNDRRAVKGAEDSTIRAA